MLPIKFFFAISAGQFFVVEMFTITAHFTGFNIRYIHYTRRKSSWHFTLDIIM